MSTKVTPLGLRLFLEGVEVPVISAQVNSGPDQPATAAIQIVPTDMSLHLLPRTLVHLFYLDDAVLEGSSSPRAAQDGAVTEDNFNRFDAPDSLYKLLFVGEVAGFSYGKNPSQRQVILQCMDLSTYWDACYQWFADYSVGGGGLTDKSHNFVGSATGLFDSVSGGHKWVIGQLLNSKPETPVYRDTKGLAGGIIHLLEAIGGVRGTRGFNGANDFFTIAELRYNIIGMIGALESDDTSARIYNHKAFFSWLRNGMTSMGSLLSFRDIINHVNQYIYHHIYPNTCPLYRPGDDEIRVEVDAPIVTFTDVTLGKDVLSLSKLAHIALSKASKNILDGVTIQRVPQTFEFVKEAAQKLDRAFLTIELVVSDDRGDIENSILKAASFVQEARSLFKEAGFDEEAGEAGTAGDIVNVSSKMRAAVNNALGALEDEIISPKKRATRSVTKKVRSASGARLYNQLFLPECYFVAPPRCNVIFPDQYFQFSFSRNFMREVSRLSLSSGLGMLTGGGRQGSKLFTRHYYAPNTPDTRNKNVFTTTTRGARILLPHEVHSGIIPKYEWANDGHRWASLARKSGKDPFFQSGKVGYLQRLANFQFYLHRWSARTMALSGAFNPFLVLGFPGLVIDRSMPAPGVVAQREQFLGRKWMPIQYLGKVISLSHAINQSGGQTQVQFSHCRTHRGLDDEFLSSLSREINETKGQTTTVQFKIRDLLSSRSMDGSEAAALLKTEEGRQQALSSKYQNRLIIENRDDFKVLVKAYAEGKLHSGARVVGTKKFSGDKVVSIAPSGQVILSQEQSQEFGIDPNYRDVVQRQDQAVVPVSSPDGSTQPAESVVFVPEQEDVLTLPESLEIILERRVLTGEVKTANATVESLLTPGWFSDRWTNQNIGEKVYRPLINTDSIVDNVSLESDEQDEFFGRTQKDEATAVASGVSGGESDVFTFSDTSEVEGSSASVGVIPGSIEEAVDALVIIYGMIKQRGGDVHDFIREYTKRDIANIEDMLGTFGLEFDDLGGVVVPSDEDNPIEGFHSRAYGDYNTDVKLPVREGVEPQAGDNALKALFPGVPSGTAVERGRITNPGKKTSIRPELDPRGRARARVLAYVRELEFSRGLMG
jgi:hypothetical protein